MGTRGFVGYQDEKGKIHGWYNHFDSYPDGLGSQVVAKLTGLSTHEIKEFFTMKLSLAKSEVYYDNHKDIFDKDWVNGGAAFILLDGGNFYKDGLFCEYSYIYDLKTNELMCFKGFGEKPDPGLKSWHYKSDDKKYYVNQVGSINFPTTAKKGLKKLFELYGVDEDGNDTPKLLT